MSSGKMAAICLGLNVFRLWESQIIMEITSSFTGTLGKMWLYADSKLILYAHFSFNRPIWHSNKNCVDCMRLRGISISWGQHKMVVTWQTTLWNVFSWYDVLYFGSNLFTKDKPIFGQLLAHVWFDILTWCFEYVVLGKHLFVQLSCQGIYVQFCRHVHTNCTRVIRLSFYNSIFICLS